MMKKEITQEELKELLCYDPETGVFTWKRDRHGKAKVGTVAGSIHKYRTNTYIEIGFNGSIYKAHRLAWLYMTGYFPRGRIDHKDGCGVNNKFSNLRDVTSSENNRNKRKNKNILSGVFGVRWRSDRERWEVQISVDCKKLYLGLFDNLFDAVCARKSAEVLYDYYSGHGEEFLKTKYIKDSIISRDYSDESNRTKGFCFNKLANKWMSYICVDGKRIHLGYYDNLFDAAAARKSYENSYSFN